MVTVSAPAKLNLGLSILERRPDGYHEIETLFVPLRLFDRLHLRPAREPGLRLRVRGPDAAGVPGDAGNLAVRAAAGACAALDLEPALDLDLVKQIPVAAGLGGGSSDAAAAILGVEELAERSIPATRRTALARALGADVPFFLDPRPALGRGVGDALEPIADAPELWWVLARFPFPVSTAEAYREAARELTSPRPRSSIAALLGPGGVLSDPENDLERVAARRHPEISAARAALRDAGARVTGMSGSGPTVYGQFGSREDAERGAARAHLPAGARALVASSPASESTCWGWGVAKR